MKSYLKFLSRNKVYTFISVAGLAVSLMFVILLGDYAWRQFSIDTWHKNSDRIYLLGDQKEFAMWPQTAEEIRRMCPEVERTCCVMSQSGKIRYGQQEVKDQENGIILLADSTFFSFFDFKLIQGDPATVLNAPDKCVITESLAKRLFASKNPIGEGLHIVGDRHITQEDAQDPYDSTLVYTVSGVVRDLDRTILPNKTQIILSMERSAQVIGYTFRQQNFPLTYFGYCKLFLMTRPGTTLSDRLDDIQAHLTKNYPSWGPYFGMDGHEASLTKLHDVMFAKQNTEKDLEKGDKTRLLILLSAVLAILFFAVSNYINLTVANTSFRAKEMATRRLFGSNSLQISLKLIAESVLMVTVSFVIGLVLAFCFQEDASSLFRGKIALQNDVSIGSLSLCLLFILFVGTLAGILPTWHLSRYQPIDIVKGSFRFHSKMVLSRVFIILQNTIAVVMLTAALVIFLQLQHLIHAPLGYNVENLYYISSQGFRPDVIRSQLEKMPFVEETGANDGTTLAGFHGAARMAECNNKQDPEMVMVTAMDSTAFRLSGLKILKDYGPASEGYYLNELAFQKLGLSEKDRQINWYSGDKSPLRGVIKDFHMSNILFDVQPFGLIVEDELEGPDFLVKTDGSKEAKPAFLKMIADQGCPETEIEMHVISLEETVIQSFEEQQNTLRIISLFTLVAVVISVMGFVGMSLFFIRQRKKEIGLRKIMGSTSREVMGLMLRTFCMPLLISFVIAVPISYYIMAHWLEDFSYRITLSPWIFAATCAFSLLVAIISVGIQIAKAARTNPVESIQTE